MAQELSRELKAALIEGTTKHSLKAQENLEGWFGNAIIKEEATKRPVIVARLEEALRVCTGIREQLEALKASAELMSDAQFKRAVIEVERNLSSLEKNTARFWESESAYTASFVKRDEVTSLKEFIEKWPMYWVPIKNEVSHLLSRAVEIHTTRMETGHASSNDPIRIADIGGANGFLAKLLVDLAKENGLNIEVTIVDPYEKVVKKAASAYADTPELKFIVSDAATFSRDQAQGAPDYEAFLKKRAQALEAANQRFRFLRTVLSNIDMYSPIKEEVGGAKLDALQYILKNDFELELKPNDTAYDLIERYLEREDRPIKKLNAELERLSPPTVFDMVINSWMPPGVDLCRDIEAARGALVVYIIEKRGATGLDTLSVYGREEVGQERSYSTHSNYIAIEFWNGPSANQITTLARDPKARLFGSDSSYLNTIMIWRRSDLEPPRDIAGKKIISAGAPYTWESELEHLKQRFWK